MIDGLFIQAKALSKSLSMPELIVFWEKVFGFMKFNAWKFLDGDIKFIKV